MAAARALQRAARFVHRVAHVRWTPHSCAYGQRHAAAALWRCRFVPSATLSTTAGHRSDVTHDDNGDNDDGVVDLLSGDLGETFQAVDLLSGAVGSGLTPSSSDTVGEEGVSLSPQTEGPFDDVVVSEAAAKRLTQLQESRGSREWKLRVWVDDGGCSGYSYHYELIDTAPTSDDMVFERDGASVVVDKMSMPLLAGSTVDLEVSLMKQGFSIVNNPNAEKGCGCGTSFAVRMD